MLARLGGYEFGVILPDAELDGTREIPTSTGLPPVHLLDLDGGGGASATAQSYDEPTRPTGRRI